MEGLPWALQFAATVVPAPLRIELTWDPVDSTLLATLVNDGADPWQAGAGGAHVIATAQLGDVAVEGSAFWPAGAGASVALLESTPAGTLAGSRACALLLPNRQPAALFLGSLADRPMLSVSVTLESGTDGVRLDDLSLRWDLAGCTMPAGGRLDLPGLLLAEGPDAWGLAQRYAVRAAGLVLPRPEPDASPREVARLALLGGWMPAPPAPAPIPVDASEVPEARLLATAVALSNGALRPTDGALNPLARALDPLPAAEAEPLDLLSQPAPFAWRALLEPGRFLVGLLNWSDTARWFVLGELLRPGEIAFDVWAGRLVGKGDILLAGGDGKLLQVTAAGPGPRVVGDSASVAYAGIMQRPVSGRIQVGNELAEARTIALEVRGQAFEVDLEPGERRWFQ